MDIEIHKETELIHLEEVLFKYQKLVQERDKQSNKEILENKRNRDIITFPACLLVDN